MLQLKRMAPDNGVHDGDVAYDDGGDDQQGDSRRQIVIDDEPGSEADRDHEHDQIQQMTCGEDQRRARKIAVEFQAGDDRPACRRRAI